MDLAADKSGQRRSLSPPPTPSISGALSSFIYLDDLASGGSEAVQGTKNLSLLFFSLFWCLCFVCLGGWCGVGLGVWCVWWFVFVFLVVLFWLVVWGWCVVLVVFFLVADVHRSRQSVIVSVSS